MISGYRELEPKDYKEISHDLENLSSWYAYKDFANKFFPDAVSFDLDIEGQSDDEGGAYYRITYISATDKDGNGLEPKDVYDEWLANNPEPEYDENRWHKNSKWSNWYRDSRGMDFDEARMELSVTKYSMNEIDLTKPPTNKYRIFIREEVTDE